jgi:hypothetical protein
MKINGKPVVDGRKSLKVSVQPNDIKGAKTKNPEECAVSKALLRENPDIKAVRVHLSRTYIERDKKWERYETPVSVRTEIVSFDRNGGFQAGEYKIRAMSPSHTVEAEREKYRHNRKYRDPRTTAHKSRNLRHEPLDVRKRASGGSHGIVQEKWRD